MVRPAPVAARRGRRIGRWLGPVLRGRSAVLVLFALLLASLVLMSDATQNSARFGELYSWLLLLNACVLALLALLIGASLLRLLGRYRRRAPGARLSLRLMLVFVPLTVTPGS